MSVDAGIAASANQSIIRLLGIFTLFSYAFLLIRVFVLQSTVLHSKSHVGHVDYVTLSTSPHHEVFRLDVTVAVSGCVKTLESLKKLIHQHQSRLQGEATATVLQEVLQVWAEHLKHQYIKSTVPPVPEDLWEAGFALELFVQIGFSAQVIPSGVVQLDGDFLLSIYIASCRCPSQIVR